MLKRRLLYFLVLLVCAALYFFENNTGTRVILFSVVLIPVISGLCAYFAAKKAETVLNAPQRAEEKTEADIEVKCGASVLSRFCSWNAKLDVRLSLDGSVHETLEISGSAMSEWVKLKTEYPGIYSVSINGLQYTDAFSLLAFDCERLPEAVRISVLPKLFKVTVDMLNESTGGETGEGTKLRGLETTGIRDYIPGDSIKLIHWKLTEKLDRPVVRETDAGEAQNGLLLILENRPPKACPTEAYAECLRGFMSCLLALDEYGIDYSVAVSDDYPETEFHPSDISFCRETFETGRTQRETVLVFSPCAKSDAFLYAEHQLALTVVPQEEESEACTYVLNSSNNHISI